MSFGLELEVGYYKQTDKQESNECVCVCVSEVPSHHHQYEEGPTDQNKKMKKDNNQLLFSWFSSPTFYQIHISFRFR